MLFFLLRIIGYRHLCASILGDLTALFPEETVNGII